MRLFHFMSCLAAASFAGSMLTAGTAAAGPRAVLELFTSQGCSSCPPADKLAGELARDPSLVVLSLPIDYWDYLGWKDTLADPRNSGRQRGYAHERGDRQVYTPQMVVNGHVHTLGSDKSGIEQAIAQSRRNVSALALAVTIENADDKLTVTIPAGKDNRGSGEIWACAVTKAVPVTIARGENRGRTITYYNVARRWVKLGDWSGKSETLNVALGELKRDGADSVAVLVQSGSREKPGSILGAALADVR
jgi:hypothetical protein